MDTSGSPDPGKRRRPERLMPSLHDFRSGFSRRSLRSSPVQPRDPNAVGLVIFLLQRLMSGAASSRLATENKGSVLRIPYVHVIVLAGNVAEAAKVRAMHSRSSRNHACRRRAAVSLLGAGVSHVIPDVNAGILIGVMEHQLVEASIECHPDCVRNSRGRTASRTGESGNCAVHQAVDINRERSSSATAVGSVV